MKTPTHPAATVPTPVFSTIPSTELVATAPSMATQTNDGQNDYENPPALEEPVVTKVVLPSGEETTPEAADLLAARKAFEEDVAQASNPDAPPRIYFGDLGSEVGSLEILSKGYRPDYIYYGQLSEALADAVLAMPEVISDITGIGIAEVEALGGDFDKAFEKLISKLSFDKQKEARNYLSGIFKRVRQQEGIVRRWTFTNGELDANGKPEVREITSETIEQLAPSIRQMLSQSIIDSEMNGVTAHRFFLQ